MTSRKTNQFILNRSTRYKVPHNNINTVKLRYNEIHNTYNELLFSRSRAKFQ